MGYVVPLMAMRLQGMSCPVCGSKEVERVCDLLSVFDRSDRRECRGCGFRTRRVESFYRGPFLSMWVEDV